MAIDLAELGITQEELVDRAVEQIAKTAVSERVQTIDEDGNPADYMETTPMGRQIAKAIQARLDTAVANIVETLVLPDIEARIRSLVLQKTNQWGEAKGEAVTFVEYVTEKAEAWMTEKVSFDGASKAESRNAHNWTGTQTRISHAVHKYLQYEIETAMKKVLGNGTATLVKGIQETVKIKLAEIADGLKVTAQLPR